MLITIDYNDDEDLMADTMTILMIATDFIAACLHHNHHKFSIGFTLLQVSLPAQRVGEKGFFVQTETAKKLSTLHLRLKPACI